MALRKPVEQATKGAVSGAKDALTPDDVAAMTRNVTDGLLRGLATVAGDPAQRQNLQLIVQAMVAGVLGGLTQALGPEARTLGPALRSATHDLSGALVDGMSAGVLAHRQELSLMLVQLSADMGRGFVRGATEEMARQASQNGGPNVAGPIGQAMSTVAEQLSASAVRGATDQLGVYLPPCQGGDRLHCLDEAVRNLSRATAAGAAEGVAKKANPWPVVITFFAGAIMALLITAAIRQLVRRRQPPPAAPLIVTRPSMNPQPSHS